jgi:urease accessory protein
LTWSSTSDAPPVAVVKSPVAAGISALPRAEGRLDVAFQRRGEKTVLRDLYQQGSAKARFPKSFDNAPPEAVLINLAGGLTGADCVQQTVDFGEGVHAIATTQAAEKIYRASEGSAPATITNKLTLKAAAFGEWLPQETIFFDGGRLRRSFHATLAEDARLIACEATVFGRTAMGETVGAGFLRDTWHVTVGDRLAFADGLCLDGRIQDQLDRPAVARGGRALASVLYVGADAAALLEPARSSVADQRDDGGRAAVSLASPAVLLARFIAKDGTLLRPMLIRYLEAIRAAAGLPGGLPRLWRC